MLRNDPKSRGKEGNCASVTGADSDVTQKSFRVFAVSENTSFKRILEGVARKHKPYHILLVPVENSNSHLLIQKNHTLRQFNPADLEAVISINRVCLPENYAPYFFIDTFNTFPEAFVVAESQGRVVGYVMCRFEHGFSDLKKLRFARKGHIISVAVMPEFRNLGIGHSLVEQAMSSLASRQVDECYLEVRVNNLLAINLYKGMGFEIARTIPRYYFDGFDAFVMAKSLT